MSLEHQRCAARSLALQESLVGTASRVTRWLLLEHPGPWGRDALRDARLPDDVRRHLLHASRDLGVRVLLLRRHGRSEPDRLHCVLAGTAPGREWVEQALLPGPAGVLDLDLAPLAAGRPSGLTPVPHPVFLVCTHGRHDPCCAERGRPLAAELSTHYPDWTWEASHLGGDRFAGNLVALPHGLYFGRVAPRDAVRVAASYRHGHVELAHFRGRSGYDVAGQVAEWHLRRHLGLTEVDALRLAGRSRDGEVITARFDVADGPACAVSVRARPADEARTLTCHAERAASPPEFELVGISHIG